MRSSIRPDGLVITDSPGCFWLFGAFFCFIGGAAVLATLASQANSIPLWQELAGVFMGLIAFCAGLFFIYQSPGTRVVIQLSEHSLSISRRGFLRRQLHRYDLASIEHVCLLQGKDIDGGPVYRVQMKLRDGSEVPLTLLWLHGKEQLEIILEQIRQHIPLSETRVSE